MPYPYHQPSVTDEQITALLQQHFSTPIMQLAPLEGGHVAQTLAFTTDGQDYVIRFSPHMERDLYEQVYTQMMHLLGSCPEERFLVHGNYGFGNVLVYEGRITAVLDWLDAGYGDFVFDLAYLTLWIPEWSLAERFQQFYAAKGIEIEHYAERLRCYQYRIGLDALRFYAQTQKADSYYWMKQRLLTLLQA